MHGTERRRRNFWEKLQKNALRWYWLVLDFAIAFLVAKDLAFYLFGGSSLAWVVWIILGLVYFWLYVRVSRYHDFSVLHNLRFGRNELDRFLSWPLYTMAFDSIVELLWSRFTYQVERNVPILLIVLAQLWHMARVYRRAFQELGQHVGYAKDAKMLLDMRQDITDPEEAMLSIVKSWVNVAFDDDPREYSDQEKALWKIAWGKDDKN